MVSLKNEKSFIYLWKISIMVCVYEILSRRECWDTYELKEIVLFPEILLLGVNSIKYMYIKNHYYNTQMSGLLEDQKYPIYQLEELIEKQQ